MKIEITNGTNLNGKLLKPGDIVEADRKDAALLIGQNQAKLYVAPKDQPKEDPKKSDKK